MYRRETVFYSCDTSLILVGVLSVIYTRTNKIFRYTIGVTKECANV